MATNKMWTANEIKLKGTYEKEYKESEIKKIAMSKEEFEKYIKNLEMKNRYKYRGIR